MKTLSGFFVTLAIVTCLAVSVSDTQAEGTTTTVSFTELGAKSFTVPAGVTSIHVVAVGAPGGSEGNASGGMGGVATADVAVTPGEVLGVVVGGTGESGGLGEGGFNGGGDSVQGEGGGGASDVRVGSPGSYASRLVVAGGGGGAVTGPDSGDIAGGSAGSSGGSTPFGGSFFCTGGGGATATQAGSGGTGNVRGKDGSLGLGGFAPQYAGGGGGGGMFGGGGGGGSVDPGETGFHYCGGGGGSSGFGPGTSATSVGISQTAQASVTISYTIATATPGSPSGPSGGSNGGSSGGSNGGSNGSSPGSPGGGSAPADLSLSKTQRGKAVTATVQVPATDSVLEAKLLWRQTKASKQLVFGRLTEARLKKGLHTFTVRLGGRGKRKLASLGALKMTLAVDINPPQGPDGVASRRVTLKVP